ncbi:MAG TPA: sugar-binding protein, partial [Acidobacteriota bacterium]|nr:sugar-binding protein [Acidobacteriota bacterium]
MKVTDLFWLTFLSAAMLGAGCSGSEKTEEATLAFLTNNAADFWTIARRGCEQADLELPGIRVEFRIPADGTAAEQRRIVDDLLAKGVDGIAISPVDPANQAPMLNQAARQAVVVTHDSDAPESDRLFYVGTDNVQAGRQAGELIRQALPDGGEIMLFVGNLDAQNARERYRGIQQALEGSNIRILDVRTDDTDRVRAKANVLDALVNDPEIDGLVGLWSYNGPAILNAVQESGKIGQVQIVCFDEEDETLAGIKQGAIFATVVQQPYEFGYQAIRLMARILEGDRSFIPDDGRIFIPTLVVDRENVDEFIERI